MPNRTWLGTRALTFAGLVAILALALACEQEPSTAPTDADSTRSNRTHSRWRATSPRLAKDQPAGTLVECSPAERACIRRAS